MRILLETSLVAAHSLSLVLRRLDDALLFRTARPSLAVWIALNRLRTAGAIGMLAAGWGASMALVVTLLASPGVEAFARPPEPYVSGCILHTGGRGVLRPPTLDRRVGLSIVTRHRAFARVEWRDGLVHCITPCRLEVPEGAPIHVEASRRGRHAAAEATTLGPDSAVWLDL